MKDEKAEKEKSCKKKKKKDKKHGKGLTNLKEKIIGFSNDSLCLGREEGEGKEGRGRETDHRLHLLLLWRAWKGGEKKKN